MSLGGADTARNQEGTLAHQEGSVPLRTALSADLRARLAKRAPTVEYAWSRTVRGASGEPMVMMSTRLRARDQSTIVDATGPDGDTAYARLLEAGERWGREQS